MNNPKVSIIIPVYKTEKYLEASVKSAINQTYGNLEIILVDDGSPDNSPAICDDFAKKYAHVSHLAEHGTQASRQLREPISCFWIRTTGSYRIPSN